MSDNPIPHIKPICFIRIYIFSPSIDVDSTWKPAKGYTEVNTNVQSAEKSQYTLATIVLIIEFRELQRIIE